MIASTIACAQVQLLGDGAGFEDPGSDAGEARDASEDARNVGDAGATADVVVDSGADGGDGLRDLLGIAILPTSTVTVPLGETHTFHAIGTFAGGSTREITDLVRWDLVEQCCVMLDFIGGGVHTSPRGFAEISNANGSAGTVSTRLVSGWPSSTLRRVAARATVRAEAHEIVASVEIEVAPIPTSMTVSVERGSIRVGEWIVASPSVTFNSGTTASDAQYEAVRWTLDDPAVATTDGSRLVGAGPGATTLRARLGELSASTPLVVRDVRLRTFELESIDDPKRRPHDTHLALRAVWADGFEQDLQRVAKARVSNPALAELAHIGGERPYYRITRKAPGPVTVTVQHAGLVASHALPD
jgi:hypothetical protein